MDLLRTLLNDENSTVTKLIQKEKKPTLPSASISDRHECVQHTDAWETLAG